MVGWLLPSGSTKSHTQTSPSGAAARMLRHPEPDRVGQGGETVGQLGGLGRRRGARPAPRGSTARSVARRHDPLRHGVSPIDERRCIDHTQRIDTRRYYRRSIMSRVQLALNVADIDAAVDFYSKLFGAEPAKRRPGYANFAIAEPPLKLVLIENAGRPRCTAWPARSTTWAWRWRPPRRSGGHPAPLGRGSRARRPRGDHLLLRRAGQGVGERSRRRPLGGLHRAGRRSSRDRARVLDRGLRVPTSEPSRSVPHRSRGVEPPAAELAVAPNSPIRGM